MTTILHISDMHDSNGNTLKPLGRLAEKHSDVDVVAVTDDCFRWSNRTPLSDSLTAWPQRLKLSVPGNHDGKETFASLREPEWDHRTPYVCLHGWDEEKGEPYIVRHKWDRLKPYVSHPHDITFIGLDTSKDLETCKELEPPKDSNTSENYDACRDFNSRFGYCNVNGQIYQLDDSLIEKGSALVVLSHRWPQADKATQLWDLMLRLCGEHRPLLILCGHEHHNLCRPERRPWSEPTIPSMKCYRSHVYSNYIINQLQTNLIIWDGECFTLGDKNRKGNQ